MIKILCSGDLHIGRRSSRLPPHLDGPMHSAAEAWRRIVDLAISEAVDLVALSGDLIDWDNRFYEAVGPLQAGLTRLAEQGIMTVAVAGNHDFSVLPRLADTLDPGHFRLLGRGGRWERLTVRRGDQVLHLDGWSFPARHVRESPLDSYDLPTPESGAVLALLHADLEQPRSQYAPVGIPELRARPVDFWLLGHIHTHYLHGVDGVAPILYPGSPQALDPGEQGAHGVCILKLEPGPQFSAEFVPLSTVRYDEVAIDLTGATTVGDIDTRIIAGLRRHLAGLVDDDLVRALSCRVRLTGRTPIHRQIAAHIEGIAPELGLPEGDMIAVIERVEIDTRPDLDLGELARGRGPVALLANLLRALQTDEPTEALPLSGPDGGSGFQDAAGVGALLDSAYRAAQEVVLARSYIGIAGQGGAAWQEGVRALDGGTMDGKPDHGAAVQIVRRDLVRQASTLLDLLLDQKGDA